MSSAFRLSLIAGACALAWPAQAQLVNHKDLPTPRESHCEGALESCQAKGYHVSVTVVGRDGVDTGAASR
jgi:hypothetical protein